MSNVPRYLVVLDTPKGVIEVETPSFISSDAAGRRAFFTACAAGYGDLDTIKLISSTPILEV